MYTHVKKISHNEDRVVALELTLIVQPQNIVGGLDKQEIWSSSLGDGQLFFCRETRKKFQSFLRSLSMSDYWVRCVLSSNTPSIQEKWWRFDHPIILRCCAGNEYDNKFTLPSDNTGLVKQTRWALREGFYKGGDPSFSVYSLLPSSFSTPSFPRRHLLLGNLASISLDPELAADVHHRNGQMGNGSLRHFQQTRPQ